MLSIFLQIFTNMISHVKAGYIKCKNGACAKKEYRCLYSVDKYGFPVGCRDSTQLLDCGKLMMVCVCVCVCVCVGVGVLFFIWFLLVAAKSSLRKSLILDLNSFNENYFSYYTMVQNNYTLGVLISNPQGLVTTPPPQEDRF